MLWAINEKTRKVLFRVFVFVHVLHITPAFVFLYSLCLIFTSLSKSFYCSFLHCSSLFTFLLHFVFRAAVLFQKSVFFSFYIFPSGGCSPHSGFFNSFYFFLFFCLSSWLVDASKLMSVNIITNNPKISFEYLWLCWTPYSESLFQWCQNKGLESRCPTYVQHPLKLLID